MPLLDNFNRADSFLDGSTATPSAGKWHDFAGVLRIVGNGVTGAGSLCAGYIELIPASADYSVKCVLRLPEGNVATRNFPGVHFRCDPTTGNKYTAYIDSPGSVIQVNAGTGIGSGIASIPITITPGETIALELGGVGSLLTVKVNDATVGTVTDTSITAAGYGGIQSYGNVTDGWYIDDLEINGTTLTNPNPAPVEPTGDWVKADDTHFFYPGNWQAAGSGATSTRSAVNTGSYFKTSVTVPTGGGTVYFVYDKTIYYDEMPANSYPLVRASIDGTMQTPVKLTSDGAIAITDITAGTHEIAIYLKSVDMTWNGGGENRWDMAQSKFVGIRSKGIYVPTGSTMNAPTLLSNRAIMFGDSITEGIQVDGGTQSAADNNATTNWAARIPREYLNAEYQQVGWSGSGYTHSGSGQPLKFGRTDNSWFYTSAGVARNFTGITDIVVNHGTNDNAGDFSTNVTQTITDLRAAAPTARIHIVCPFPTDHSANRGYVEAGVASYKSANPSDNKVFDYNINDLDDYVQNDLHPNQERNNAIVAALGPRLALTLDNTAPTVNAVVATNGLTVGLAFSENVTSAGAPSDWVLKVDGVVRTITSITFSGPSNTATFHNSVIYQPPVVVTLDYVGTSVADAAGNKLAAFTNKAVTNGSTVPAPDVIAPSPPTLGEVENFSGYSRIHGVQSSSVDAVSVQPRVNGADYGDEFETEPGEAFSFDVTGTNGVSKTVTAKALDGAGNVSVASNAVEMVPGESLADALVAVFFRAADIAGEVAADGTEFLINLPNPRLAIASGFAVAPPYWQTIEVSGGMVAFMGYKGLRYEISAADREPVTVVIPDGGGKLFG